MALTAKEWPLVDLVLGWAWLVQVRREGKVVYKDYLLDGVQYTLVYEYKRLTWTTPAGEIRPCIRDSCVLTDLLVVRKKTGV